MKLKRIMDSLALGELAHTGYVNVDGTFKQDKYPAVINSINLALTALYTFFDITEKEVFVEQQEGVSTYVLDPIHSKSVGTHSQKYIVDSPEDPFLGDVLIVTKAYDELGRDIAINDENDEHSIYTTDYRTIWVPNPIGTSVISFIYMANAVHLDISTTDDDTEVVFPDILLEPLLFYTASRLLGALMSPESQAKSDKLMVRYATEVNRLKELNAFNSSYTETSFRIERGNWV